MRRGAAVGVLLVALSLTPVAVGSPPEARAQDGNFVGYVGCSQSTGSVQGYHQVGGTRFWRPIVAYGGGTVEEWYRQIGKPGRTRWTKFSIALQDNPATVLWWQICDSHRDPNSPATMTHARAVLTEMKRISGGLPVYVSGLNSWTSPCFKASPQTVANTLALRDQIVNQGLAARGPSMGTLRADQTTDGCSPNESGKRGVLGPALYAFFG